ncbi:PPC domain-containing protein [Myxococcus sp. Y35]|uniref:PPC domain-containing protein n=1 Tax=Pseudomyxococcus flavus TaxID=3115648 RepID=UPI003CF0E55F
MRNTVGTFFTTAWLACALAACGGEPSTNTPARSTPRPEKQRSEATQPLVQVSAASCTNPIPLGNGTPMGDVSGAADDWSCTYTLTVSGLATRLEFVTSGGTGDGDLFVKYGEAPTTSSSTCKSTGYDNNERCVITNVREGTYYVRMLGYSDFSGVTLTGTYTPVGPPSCDSTHALSNGTPVEGIDAPAGSYSCVYTLDVPAGASDLRFTLSGGSGDGTLLMKYGSVPNNSSSDCKSQTAGSNSESCRITAPQAGTYYVRVLGNTSVSGARLVGSYYQSNSCTDVIGLTNGTPAVNVGAAIHNWSCVYTLDVAPGASDLRIVTSGGTGDGDLYVKYGAVPTVNSRDCESAGSGTQESCTIAEPRAGTYYVRMLGYTPFSGVNLTATYTPECTTVLPLTRDAPTGGIGALGKRWSCIYALEVPERATDLKFITSGGTGNGDLYVKFGSAPDASSYDCKSTGTTSAETCTLPVAQAGTYYARMYGPATTAFSGVNLTSSYVLGKPVGCTGTNALSNGTPEGGVGAAAHDWSCLYTLEVPPGATNVRFVTSGGTGNGDLYVKRGTPVSDTSYDCKSTGDTNSETCAISAAQPGTYYVRMHGPAAFSGVSLTGSYNSIAPPGCTSVLPLSNGAPTGGVGASAGTWSCHYTLDVPAGAANLQFTTSGGSGDGDLYVRFGAAPEVSAYDCKSATGASEACTIPLAQAGTYHVRMYGYTSFSGVSLMASYTSTVLDNGVPVNGLSGTVGAWSSVYTLEVPAGATNLQFVTTGGTGNSDLYVKHGAPPSDTSYDCRSTGSATHETCAIPAVQAGTYYVRVHGPTPFSGVSLTGSYTPPAPPACADVIDLANGSSATNLGAAAGDWSCTYALEVPVGAGSLRFATSGGSGNGDLYVRYGAAPDGSAYDCKSTGSTTAEACTFPEAQAGTYYVRVRGAGAFSGVRLTGAYIPIGCNENLTNGVPVNDLHAGADAWSCLYALEVPAGASNLKFVTSGGTGNASLYVRHGSAPDSSTFDCKSSGITSSETCTIPQARAGTYYVRLFGAGTFSGVKLMGSYSSSDCTQALSNGVPVEGLHGSADTWSCTYTLDVPEGAADLVFESEGIAAGAAVYVRHGSAPDSSAYDCKSSGSYYQGTCHIPQALAGTYYVRLYGVRNFTGTRLTGTYVPSIALSNGTPEENISGESWDWSSVYTLEVPAGATQLKFVTRGGSGNSDLYVRFGATPSNTSVYDCKSAGSTTSETCTITLPLPGTYHARLHGPSAFSGVALTGSYTDTNPVPPDNDTCDAAETLVFNSEGVAQAQGDTTLGDNSNASGDASPSCSPSARASGNDVVYRLTLTESRSIQVTVTPTDARLAPVVYLRESGNCSSPIAETELACSVTEAEASGPAELFYPELPPGEYFLWVDGGAYKGPSGPASFGRFGLQVKLRAPVLPPSNETCGTAQPLVFEHGVARVTGDTRNASNDHHSVCGSGGPLRGPDVAYVYTLDEEQDVFINLGPIQPAPDWTPVLYTGELRSCTLALTGATCDSGRPNFRRFRRQSPGTYVIWVDGLTAADAGSYELTVTTNTPSRNDTCSSAKPLVFDAAGDAFERGDTTYASDSGPTAGEPSCGTFMQSGNDLVYTVTVPPGLPQQFSFVVEPTVDSTLIPYVYLRSACSTTNLADQLVCAAPHALGYQQSVGTGVARLNPGTYYLYVDSRGYEGAFRLYAHLGAPNDTCATARPVPVASDAMPGVAASNIGMTNDYGPGSVNPYGGTCESTGSPTVDSVYSFTAPETRTYYVEGSGVRLLGESCAPAACSESPLFEATEGQTYYFVLDQGSGSTTSGASKVRVREYPWW